MPHHLSDMPLNAGDRLGAYEITGELGAGGMGIVLRARDSKLDRDVALKVLPEAFAADPDRLARFEREAKVLASLNHPNIGSIYGLEEAEGGKFRALVLELVEGPTLADRISKGPIPLDEALPIAKQIAEALEAAHEAGVIHRDLKPANIKVREDGTVKVLDFGLAKALDPNPVGDPSQSPTLTAAATQMGVILGTAAYMSPEQARGKTVDKRADIWAFGCVLYEMLSGQRPFTGRDVSEVLGGVLRVEPEWEALPGDTPPRVNTLLRRCLEKEPKQRVHDVADARLAMEGAFETTVTEPTETPAAAPRPVWLRPVVALIVVLLVAIISGLAVWSLTRPTPPAPRALARFVLQIPPDVALQAYSEVAISRSGTHVVYATGEGDVRDGQLYVRQIGELVATPLRGSQGGFHPFFSPNGQSVGFVSQPGPLLKRISVHGGSATTIVAPEAAVEGASWGADETIVFGTSNGLMLVPAVGGEPERLTTIDPGQGDTAHAFPDVLPNLTGVLFSTGAGVIEDSRVAVVSLETGAVSYLLQGGSHPRYSPTGHIIYSGGGGTLWAVGFDADRLELTSINPVPVVEEVYTRQFGRRGSMFALADNGSFVYTAGSGDGDGAPRSLVWVDREGGEEPLATPVLSYESASVSPDGTHVAYAVGGATADIWVHDLERGTETRLTTHAGRDYLPLWAPDGERIVFTSERGGGVALFQKHVDAPGDAERLGTGSRGVTNMGATGWSADGQTLLYWEARARPPDVGRLSMGGDRATELLLDTEFVEVNAVISPDGGWMAYESYETGQAEVYVQRFPGLGGKQPISTNGGQHPLWSLDRRELFYRTQTAVMRVPVLQIDPTFRAGSPEVLFETPGYLLNPAQGHDLHPDGQRFLMVKGVSTDESLTSAEPQIVLVENWFEELKRLVPVP